MCGGILSCWNHPFEVARIEMQARAFAGENSLSIVGVFRNVYAEYGVQGLFQVRCSTTYGMQPYVAMRSGGGVRILL